MNTFSRKLKIYANVLGYNPSFLYWALKRLPSFLKERSILKQQSKNSGGEFPMGKTYPNFADKYADAGLMSGDYFHQDYFVAKKIFMANPAKHVDIGSRIEGFVAHVAVFREIEVLDIRNIESTITNIVFRQADLMNMPPDMENYCDSVSSLHAIEHFGLGRYGDPIDYYGYKKALKNITAILRKGGTFYLSVPIGRQRIEFNSHRIFSPAYVWGLLKEDYELISFSHVDTDGNMHENTQLAETKLEADFTEDYIWGCGIFELKKK